MTEAEMELARRLVAHPKWPDAMKCHGFGMVVAHRFHECPMLIRNLWDDGSATIVADGAYSAGVALSGCVPHLDQPATQGCLIAMLFDEDEWAEVGPTFDNEIACNRVWEVYIPKRPYPAGEFPYRVYESALTLGEALARSLLAAWGEQ